MGFLLEYLKNPRFIGAVATKRIIISLTNTLRDGAGISTENMFGRFCRDDKARSDPQSSGLGLAIAKAVAEAHDGSVCAYNKQQHPEIFGENVSGAVFDIVLPYIPSN